MSEELREDTVAKVKTYDPAVQQAWNLLSMHNSELLLENYQLKEQLNKVWAMSISKFIVWKLKGMLRSRYE